ncbi:MAG TPA: hypothetical protein VFQ53_25585 [Kofleriaceae bacterium]|nr:hypothetical protein [Kofleriaceae bacterium]
MRSSITQLAGLATVVVCACAEPAPRVGEATGNAGRSAWLVPGDPWSISIGSLEAGTACERIDELQGIDGQVANFTLTVWNAPIAPGTIALMTLDPAAVPSSPVVNITSYTSATTLGGYDPTARFTGTLQIDAVSDDGVHGVLTASGSTESSPVVELATTFRAPSCD